MQERVTRYHLLGFQHRVNKHKYLETPPSCVFDSQFNSASFRFIFAASLSQVFTNTPILVTDEDGSKDEVEDDEDEDDLWKLEYLCDRSWKWCSELLA